MSQQEQFYHIMVLISNGNVSDMEATVETIVSASDIPISIIIIGVGDNNFEKFEILDADEEPLKDTNGQV